MLILFPFLHLRLWCLRQASARWKPDCSPLSSVRLALPLARPDAATSVLHLVLVLVLVLVRTLLLQYFPSPPCETKDKCCPRTILEWLCNSKYTHTERRKTSSEGSTYDACRLAFPFPYSFCSYPILSKLIWSHTVRFCSTLLRCCCKTKLSVSLSVSLCCVFRPQIQSLGTCKG